MASRGDYSIRIVNERGDGLSDKRVHLTFWGTFGGTWEDAFTGEDGWAHFVNCPLHIQYVTVSGTTIEDDDFMMEDGGTRSFTIPD
jgi:hypothetical protein